MIEQGRADEEALLVPLKRKAAAIDDEFRALGGAQRDVVLDLGFVGGGDDGTVLRVLVAGDADLQRLDFRDHPLAEGIRRLGADRHDHGQRHAPLPRRPERRAGEVLHHEVEVGVGQDDGVVLCPAHGLYTLSRRGAAPIDVMGDVG